MGDEAPPSEAEAPPAEAEAPPAEAEAPPAEEAPVEEAPYEPAADETAAADEASAGEEAPAEGEEGVSAEPAAEEDGASPEPQPMTEEQAALKIQTQQRGKATRERIAAEKGFEHTPGIATPYTAGLDVGDFDGADDAGISEEEAAARAEAERLRLVSVDPAQSRVSGPALLKCVAGCPSSCFLQAYNGAGMWMEVEESQVKVNLKSEAENGPAPEISLKDLGAGKFEIWFEPKVVGNYTLSIMLDGQHVSGSPFNIWCVGSWHSVSVANAEDDAHSIPGYFDKMSAPCWLHGMMVVMGGRWSSEEAEEAVLKMELYTMDKNESWEVWYSYGLADLDDEKAYLARKEAAMVCADDDEQMLVVFGGNRDAPLPKDAKKDELPPIEVLAEPLLIQFADENVKIAPPRKVEGTTPPARYGHSFVRVVDLMVLFGGVSVDGPCTNDVHTLSIRDGGVWNWRGVTPSGRPPSARSHHGCAVHRKTMIVYGGADTNGAVLQDLFLCELSAAPVWTEVICSGVPSPGPRLSTSLSCMDDPDYLGLLVYGGETPADEDTFVTHNDLWYIHVENNTGSWELKHNPELPIQSPQLPAVYEDKIYVTSASTVPKSMPGAPPPLAPLDQIHELTPATLMQPTTPEKPEIVRELGNACVLAWDTLGMSEGDLYVNNYFLEMRESEFAPFLLAYSGPNTTFYVKNLVKDRVYTFRVRASNGPVLSEWSSECQFEAGEPATESPSPADSPEPPAEGDAAEDGEANADAWYEQWLEEEAARQEEETKERIKSSFEDKQRRALARQAHEEMLDYHVVTSQQLGDVKDENARLHSEVAALVRERRRTGDAIQTNEPVRNFGKVLMDVTERLRELEAEEDNRENLRETMQTRLDHKVAAAELVHTRFHTFKREIAMEAENSRTGKKIPEKQLKQIEDNEQALDDELKTVRLRNIVLKHELARLESWLQSKEVLGEGLHLIDFEQLKIENQTLNEKIEERNEELLKLRKKNTQTVQVLTHIKEKLQFVQADNQLQKDKLADLETDLAIQRDGLAQEKKNLDLVRQDRVKLKEKSGLVDSDDLLYDFEKTKDKIIDLRAQLKDLQDKRRSCLSATNEIIREQEAAAQDSEAYNGMM